MDMNEYVLEVLVRDRLADMRERGEQSYRVRAAKPESRPPRFAFGQALMQLGHRLRGVAGSSQVTTEAAGAVESRRPSTHGAVRG